MSVEHMMELKADYYNKLITLDELIEKAERAGLQEVYDRLDEGVCDICPYENTQAKCYKNCTHEGEVIKGWLAEKLGVEE